MIAEKAAPGEGRGGRTVLELEVNFGPAGEAAREDCSRRRDSLKSFCRGGGAIIGTRIIGTVVERRTTKLPTALEGKGLMRKELSFLPVGG